MQKIMCPKCGEEFTIDENNYAQLLKQVKGKEIKAREEALISKLDAQSKLLMKEKGNPIFKTTSKSWERNWKTKRWIKTI